MNYTLMKKITRGFLLYIGYLEDNNTEYIKDLYSSDGSVLESRPATIIELLEIYMESILKEGDKNVQN